MKQHLSDNNNQPPGWAVRWLRFYCRPSILEDLEGDLHEYFNRNAESRGIRIARFIYILDVLKFMRPYTLRKPKIIQIIIHWIMLHSYLKTSGRSIIRNKLFSTINILGLAVSMSVGMILISLLNDLNSYDDFHEDKENIYRLKSTFKDIDDEPSPFASSSVKAGRLMREQIPGIDDLVILTRSFNGDGNTGEKTIPLEGIYAEPSFFKIFNFPFIEGDPRTALNEPYSLVLTEKAAERFFGDSSAINHKIRFDTVDYVVTGVIKDIPKFSHLRFESLVSFATAEIKNKDNGYFTDWRNIWSNYVYIKLNKETSPASVKEILANIAQEENKAYEHVEITFDLQPLSSIALGENLSNQIGPTLEGSTVWIIIGLAIVVLISACFNYTNLSIARAMRRSREIGIRKVIGAHRAHVIGQFLTEAILISFLAMILGTILFVVLRPHFLSLDGAVSEMTNLDLTPKLITYFILLALFTGLLAGILPAIFFSRMGILRVLKDSTQMQVFQHLNVRRVLLVLQYTFSLIFITATVIAFNQYKGFLATDLGFETENILNVRLQGNDAGLVADKLGSFSEIEMVSKSMMVTSVGSYWSSFAKYNNQDDSLYIYYNVIDENYIPLHGHELIAGRNFNYAPDSSTENEVIVNEETLLSFDMGAPEDVIGEQITIDNRRMMIIGVLKNFNYGRADQEITPVAFRHIPGERFNFVNLKARTKDPSGLMSGLEDIWKEIDPVHPMEARFYNEQIEEAFAEFTVITKIVGFLAFLSICIASMGLLGMVVFTTETRIREISIRKVLGASTQNLLITLSRNFLILLLISGVIALPLTYLLFENVILADFANRNPIGLMELLYGFMVVMAIALILIIYQSMQVVKRNPAEVLKSE